MATNLSASDLANLQKWYAQYAGMGNGLSGYQQFSSAPPTVSAGGMNFGFQGTQHQDEGGSYWTPSSGTVEAVDPNDSNYAYSVDPQTGALSNYKINKGGSFWGGMLKQDILPVVATLGSMYLGGLGLGALGAGSAAGIGGSGIGAAGTGAAAAMSPADAFALSDSVYGGSGLSAGELSSAAAGGAGTGLGGVGGFDPGAGTDIFGGNGMATGFSDSGTAGGALDAGYAGSGALTGTTGAVAPGTSGGLLPSGASSLLGPAASLIGAAIGSKPQTTTQTEARDIPAWLKPYVTGQGGLLPGAQALFQQQTAPGAMPGYAQMQNVGMGLLSQPIAGNPFANGYRGGSVIPRG